MKKLLSAIILLCALGACSDSDDDTKDTTYPEITDAGIEASPLNCLLYQRGKVIPFKYVFMDNKELGSFNIEIHNNFDHHSHSTSAEECQFGEKKKPVNPWVFNQDYTIPENQRTYTASFDIPIPDDIDLGDYHFMIRLTDKAGCQQIKSVSIKIDTLQTNH